MSPTNYSQLISDSFRIPRPLRNYTYEDSNQVPHQEMIRMPTNCSILIRIDFPDGSLSSEIIDTGNTPSPINYAPHPGAKMLLTSSSAEHDVRKSAPTSYTPSSPPFQYQSQPAYNQPATVHQQSIRQPPKTHHPTDQDQIPTF